MGSFSAPMKHYRICDGKFEFIKDIEDSGPAPSYIIRSTCKKYIYCTSEIPKSLDSGVCAFACNGTEFSLINRVVSEGISPCHICFDDTEKYIFVSNYMGGNVVVLPINSDGSLSAACQSISHKEPISINGTLKIPNRSSAHVHQAVYLSPSSTVLICDLGLDTIFSYRYDNTRGEKSLLEETSRWHCRAGAGPRHLVMHPNGEHAYLLSEIDCTLVALKVNKTNGSISPSAEELEYHSLMRHGEAPGSMNGAEVLISSDGRFVYASNRDVSGGCRDSVASKFEAGGRTNCSISVFAVSDDGAKLSFIQQVHSRGRHPRGMTLAEGGASDTPVLLVANKDEGYQSTRAGGNLVYFPLDCESGQILEDLAVVTENQQSDDNNPDGNDIVEPTWILVL